MGVGLCQRDGGREGGPPEALSSDSITPRVGGTQGHGVGGSRLSLYLGPSMFSLEEPNLCWPQTLTPRTLTVRQALVQETGWRRKLLRIIPPPSPTPVPGYDRKLHQRVPGHKKWLRTPGSQLLDALLRAPKLAV